MQSNIQQYAKNYGSTQKPENPKRLTPSPRIKALAERYEGTASTNKSVRALHEKRQRHDPILENHAVLRSAAATVRQPLGGMNWQPIQKPLAKQSSPSLVANDNPPLTTQLCSPQHDAEDTESLHQLQQCLHPSVSVSHGSIGYTLSRTKVSARESVHSRRCIDGLPTSSKNQVLVALQEKESDHRSDRSEGPVSCKSVETDVGQSSLTFETKRASTVFSADAYPLHFPDVDAFLQSPEFRLPKFSDPIKVMSEHEARLCSLYSVDRQPSMLEVCGSQLTVPSFDEDTAGSRNKPSHSESVDLMEQGGVGLEMKALRRTWSADTLKYQDKVKQATDLDDPLLSETVEISSGVSTKFSTQSTPKTRYEMFPPLMLLRNSTLDELKSNAVGPRKPPGGFIGSLPRIGSLMGTILDFVIGTEGSTLAAGIFRLQLFIDFIQVMNLNLHYLPVLRGESGSHSKSMQVFSSIIALDFVSVFGGAIIILFFWMGIVFALLIAFYTMSRKYNPNRTLQGYDSQPWLFRLVWPTSAKKTQPIRRSTAWSKFRNVAIVFVLTVLYIPLSKLSVDALVWNANYWPDKKHDTSSDNVVGTTNFCYTTTTKNDQFNWAYAILPMSALTLILYTILFPFLMMKTITHLLPKSNQYDELGQKRSSQTMDVEYMRLLKHDSSPLNFMYNAYRRPWGNYKPLYILCFKLPNLLVISVFTQQNCLWQKFSTRNLLISQQSVLICLQVVLLVVHLFVQPFVDAISNRSELVSRLGYVVTSVLGLLVAVQVKGSTVYQSTILYVVYSITYTLNIYFSLAGTSWMAHVFKRIQGRIDFSIDVFSPSLHLEKHIKRRVWQETLSAILLTGPEYRMPQNQLVTFSIDDGWPPYLLQFQGTAAERHVENLKIVKSVGIETYASSVEALYGNNPMSLRLRSVIDFIQTHLTGQDAYWCPKKDAEVSTNAAFQGISSYFGKAFLVPFPPTLVMRYDQVSMRGMGYMPTVQLTTLEALEEFVGQNVSESVKKRREVRQALRALNGQSVYCPHVEMVKHGQSHKFSSFLGQCRRQRHQYSLDTPIFYEKGTLRVHHQISSSVDDADSQAGFDVFITYPCGQFRDAQGISVLRKPLTIDAAAAFGLHDNFELVPSVQRFFRDNDALVRTGLPRVRAKMQHYRHTFFEEARRKQDIMKYSFLTQIYDSPAESREVLDTMFASNSACDLVRSLPSRFPATTTLLTERLKHINQTRVHQWWYIFWDDLWRQNSEDYTALRRHRRFFSPMFPTSIAYTPMSRSRLEVFLKSKKGIWQENPPSSPDKRPKQHGVFNRGLLNRLFFALDTIIFVSGGIQSSAPCDHVNKPFDPPPVTPDGSVKDPLLNSRHTGGGANQDNTSIVERYAWPWTEQKLVGRPSHKLWRRAQGKIWQWLAIRPYKLRDDVEEIQVCVCLLDGKYIAARPTMSSS